MLPPFHLASSFTTPTPPQNLKPPRSATVTPGHRTVTRRAFFAAALGGLIGSQNAAAAPMLAIGRQQTRMQPSGSLSSDETWKVAEHILAMHFRDESRLSVYEVFLMRVAGTGSMRPAIGDGDVVIMEMAPFETLGRGDVVWAIDGARTVWGLNGERTASSLLHRITGGDHDGWVTRGDNNLQPDAGLLTRAEYRARVCQVIHCRKQRA